MKSKPTGPVVAYLLLVLAIATWAGNLVLGRAMHGQIPPLSLNFYRWSVSFLILLPIAWKSFVAERDILIRHWKWLLALSCSGIVLFHSFVYTALTTTTAINAGLMMAVCPIIIPGVSYLIHRNAPTGLQMAGIVASVLGVAVIITRGDPHVLLNLTFKPGDLWILAAVPMWAFYSVILKDRPVELSARAMMLAITGIATILLLPIYIWEATTVGGFAVNATSLITIAYLSIVASVIAYFAWNKGVGEIGAIKAGPFLHLLPVFSAVLAVVFLGETIRSYHIPGIALIAVGIALTLWKGKNPVENPI